jgi:hypothetical protein
LTLYIIVVIISYYKKNTKDDMSENIDNKEGIPEALTGDFSLNRLLEREANKIKERQGLTGDHSLGELLDMENEETKDGFSVTEQKTTSDEKQARQELSQRNLEEVKIAKEELEKRKLHDYTIEILYHFNCGECKQWWSYATTPGQPIIDQNTKLVVGDKMFLYEGIDIYCPHCGHCENTKIKEGFLDNFSDDQTMGDQHQKYSDYWNTPLDDCGNIEE